MWLGVYKYEAQFAKLAAFHLSKQKYSAGKYQVKVNTEIIQNRQREQTQ